MTGQSNRRNVHPAERRSNGMILEVATTTPRPTFGGTLRYYCAPSARSPAPTCSTPSPTTPNAPQPSPANDAANPECCRGPSTGPRRCAIPAPTHSDTHLRRRKIRTDATPEYPRLIVSVVGVGTVTARSACPVAFTPAQLSPRWSRSAGRRQPVALALVGEVSTVADHARRRPLRVVARIAWPRCLARRIGRSYRCGSKPTPLQRDS